MPKVGCSRPYLAEYSHNGFGEITYSKGVPAGRMVSHNFTPTDTGADNKFFTDNKEAENAGGEFTGGTMALVIAELTPETAMLMFGITATTVAFGGEVFQHYVFDETKVPKYLGYGYVEKSIIQGVSYWCGRTMCKIKPNMMANDVTTQGESITWQTDTINANVLWNDANVKQWQTFTEYMDSEAKADRYVRGMLNIKQAHLETLTVISVPGTATGETKVTVTPELVDGRTYVYKTAATVAMPEVYEDLTAWDAWDGAEDITAVSGHEIVIAEVDATKQVLAAGKTIVSAKA